MNNAPPLNEDLPEGWSETNLSEVTELVSGAGFPLEHQGRQGLQYPFFKVGNLGDVDSGETLFCTGDTIDSAAATLLRASIVPPGSILFAKIGMAIRLNRRRQAGVPCCIDNNMMAAIPRTPIEPRLLLRYLETIDFMPLTQATTVPSLRKGDLEGLPVPLPPLAEQQRIVAKVESLLARVNAARQRLVKVPAILKRFRQSVLAAACSGRLTAQWREDEKDLESAIQLLDRIGRLRRERYDRACRQANSAGRSRPRDYDNYRPTVRDDLILDDLPEDWAWVDFRFLMDEQEAFCYGVVQPEKDDPSGVFLIRAGDLDGGTINTARLRRIPREVDGQYSRSRVKGGELLVTVVGAGIGTVAIVPNSCAGFNIARAVAKVPIRDFCARYIFHWLNSATALAWLKSDSREVARPTLNLEQLKTLPVPLPPLAEQQEIVRRVEALLQLADAIEKRVAAATARAEKLTQAILAKAFRGELVATEAELARREGRPYEPASVLLQRIRLERSQDASRKKS